MLDSDTRETPSVRVQCLLTPKEHAKLRHLLIDREEYIQEWLRRLICEQLEDAQNG